MKVRVIKKGRVYYVQVRRFFIWFNEYKYKVMGIENAIKRTYVKDAAIHKAEALLTASKRVKRLEPNKVIWEKQS